ncbi:MAG: hypothetical protein AAF479_05945 [Pseudomonadota bacterium]
MNSADPICAILDGDVTLVAMLANYGALPAIFMQDPVPVDALRPYIASPGDLARSPLALHMDGTDNPVFDRDIVCISDRNSGPQVNQDIADRVHALFYRNGSRTSTPVWAGGGYRLIETDVVAGPVITPTDDTLYGRTITVSLTLVPET